MNKCDDEKRKNEVISLKEFMLDRCLRTHEAMEKSIEIKMKSNEKALDLARYELDIRLASMNEFREQLKDQATRFVTRTEHAIVVNEIRELREFKATIQGKASQTSVYIAWGIAIISIFLHWIK